MTGPNRLPPNDVDAERLVISAALMSDRYADDVEAVLRAEDCYDEKHRLLLEAIYGLRDAGRAVDLENVANWLRDRGKLEQAGGTPYLIEVTNATPAIVNCREHAQRVADKAAQCRMINTCERLAAEGYAEIESREYLERAESEVYEAATATVATQHAGPEAVSAFLGRSFREYQERARKGLVGLSWGLRDLDERTGGCEDGKTYVVAGRPGMGKTSFVLNPIIAAAKARCVPVLFELEQQREEMALKLLVWHSQVDPARIKADDLDRDEWSRLTAAQNEVHGLPIVIDDRPAIQLSYVRANLRRIMARIKRGDFPAERLGPVVIDYLQLMRGPKEAGNREQEISAISRGLKEIAKEFRVPVIALSQLNRAVETRKDRRPTLADLRESGAIEQDADLILFLYRDGYYNRDSDAFLERSPIEPEDAPVRERVEAIIAKQRGGATGKVDVRWTGAYTRFDDYRVESFNEFDHEFDNGFTEPTVGGEEWN